ncbi:hypothetical protein ACFYT3_15380 [Nocardia amikacinitolerans]|uniref:hypothetical protein n=1 Tax=Nocardia amikacinitolerans TaxID=756689 RepID=UPI0036B55993
MRQIVDYSQPGQDAAFALVGALASLPPAPASPPAELPEPPPAPLSYLTDLIDQVSQPGPLTHAQQRQILIQLQPALRSADSEERKGSHYILETFSKREDLYADIDRMLNGVRRPEGQDSAVPSPFISEGTVTRRDAAPPSKDAPVQEPIPAQAATDYQKPYSTHAAYPLPPSSPTQRQRRGIPTFVLALVAVIVVAAGGIGAWFLLRDSGGTQRSIGAVEGPPIPVGKQPWGIEKGEGFVWTTNRDESTISKIDPATGTAKQIAVGGVPQELVVTPGAVWVWNYTDGVTRVNIGSSQVDREIPVKGLGSIAGIAAGGGYVWLSHADNTVTRIDAKTGTRTGDPIPVGKEPRSMAFGNGFLYVVNSADRTISAIDTTGTVRGRPLELDDALGGIAVVDGTIYVGTTDDVTVIDERSFAMGEPIPLRGGSLFTADGKGIWVAFPLENELRWFDHTGSEAKGGPITGIGKGITDLALIDDVLWMVDQPANSVVRVRVH